MHTKHKKEHERTKACPLKLCAGQWIVKSRFFLNARYTADKIHPRSGLPLCFGNSFEMQLAFHPGPTSYMQWSNTLSNLALWSTRLWRAQPCLIPWKYFSVCLHRCVSYRLISHPVLKLENVLNCSRTGSYSIGTTFPFLYSFLPTIPKKKKKVLFLVRDARCHWLNLRAADHGSVDNTSEKLSLSLFLFSQ